MTRASFNGLGVTPDASGDNALQDLLNRAALDGFSFTLIPDPVVRLVTVDQWPRLRDAFAVEQGAAFQDHGAEVRVARAFRPAAADLADVAALQLRGSRNVSVVRARSDEAYKALATCGTDRLSTSHISELDTGVCRRPSTDSKPGATTARGPGQSTSWAGQRRLARSTKANEEGSSSSCGKVVGWRRPHAR